ncbi:hypothetical protein GBA52_020085 [Prunus armeniaca]|nr:hypothetical protein GBA52_020085 [Prunus armeniaca]
MEDIRRKLGFWQCIVVDSVGASGGLCLLWMEEVTIHACSFSRNHFNVDAEILGLMGKWRLTGFYGWPVTSDRYKSWDFLEKLGQCNSLMWLCLWDFNEIIWGHEKVGGNPRSVKRQMMGFRHAVDVCGLKDLGFSSPKFTCWHNWSAEIRIRLDCVLATKEWWECFHGSRVVNLNPSKSDHIPIRLSNFCGMTNHKRKNWRFVFEEV